MNFTKRTKAPVKGEKYYSTLNPFAGGKYDMFDRHNLFKGNCTHYAWGRMSETMQKKCSLPTSNAGTWYEKTKYDKGQTPKVGAIIEYKHKGKTTGHVAFVEEIKPNGNLILTMSGWNTYLWKTREVKKSNNYCYSDYVLVGFIYNPVEFDNIPKGQHYTGEYPKIPLRGYFKLKDKGTEVKKLQKLLNWLNDCNLSIDGIVGPKTITQVSKFQKNNKLVVDGKWGKNTQAKAKTITK